MNGIKEKFICFIIYFIFILLFILFLFDNINCDEKFILLKVKDSKAKIELAKKINNFHGILVSIEDHNGNWWFKRKGEICYIKKNNEWYGKKF